MPYVIGIDVGGTFTDAFAADDGGRVFSAKVPSTPPDFARGVLNSVDALAADDRVRCRRAARRDRLHLLTGPPPRSTRW